ncbi:SurA N-terminal domain-containing protein [Alteromonas sp.]|uniref:SurA N-terminal domain-containing protein n=1 Tax=Alteromonas sp. TaxID=232 RepID=UPI000B6B4091|nr:SurA N-terminal domain-containing protein [Alteromonas sp.]MAI36669.1 peptidylprolyl isomerase [Alteromonas sp.]OUX90884.1 MAG: peptidylprolyl isomerase [Alteromonas sp. TMED35]|tara:strand:+ start:4783 stop:6675 length:1893 start_codon:yes stop_codon:yes gene_type:complete
MLERIREGSQGPWAMAIIALIVLSFVFAGVGSYLTSPGTSAVATVNGEEISAQELDRAYQNQRAQMESQFGESVAQLFSSEEYLANFRRSALDRLISEKLIQQQASEIGLRVSDEQIRETIVRMPEFQFGGQFDNERFQTILRQNGFSPADFRNYLRIQMTQNQLAAALTTSAFALDSEVEEANMLQRQTRDAKYLMVSAASFADSVEVSEADIETFYNNNIASFDTEEKVKLAYVKLSVEDLKGRVSVDDDAVRTYYEANLPSYGKEEERRVSHILIESGDDVDAARAEIEALKAQLDNGADFATLASENSDDTFSAENGGDLDFITPEMMDAEFDEAAFALDSVGDVSDIVETDFGFHIIKLTDINEAQTKSFEEVASDIRESLLYDQAMEKYFELQNTLAEIAFEVPDTLEDAANAVNLPVQETALFSRNTAPEELNLPALLDDAFSSELIEERLNSDIIELDDENIVAIRVIEHEPQRTQSLGEVRDSITASVKSTKAREAAQAWASDVAVKVRAGEDVSALLSEKSATWETPKAVPRNGGTLAAAVVETLFALAPEGEGSVDVATTMNGDVAVVQLEGVNAAPVLEAELGNSLKERLGQMKGQRLYEQYIEALRSQADVTIAESV